MIPSNYNRRAGKISHNPNLNLDAHPEASREAATETSPSSQGISIDGFDQVVQMLRIADPEFRESILRRLDARDPSLARSLRRDLF